MKTINMLFLSMSLASPLAQAVPMSCPHIYTKQTEQAPAISTNSLISTLTVNGAIKAYANTKTNEIGWQTFEDVKSLKKEVQFYLKYYNNLAPEAKLQERRTLLVQFQQDPALKKFFEVLENPNIKEYTPTQFEMRRKLLTQIIGILRILPTELRPKISKVAWDQRRDYLNDQANALVKESEASFDALLAQDGYTYQELVDVLRASTDPYVKKALRLVDRDLEIGTYVRQSGRFWTPKLGFQNVYVANTSAGGDTTRQAFRHSVEAAGLNSEMQKYYQLDDEIKPKYGVFQSKMVSSVKRSTGASGYGEDFYAFKKTEINRRLTFFFGDSFGIASFLNGLSFGQHTGVTATAKNWRGRFVPWSRKMMMVPYLVERLKSDNTLAPQLTTETYAGPVKDEHLYLHYASMIEAQIFGQLDLNMVESLSFRGSPPEGEYLAELRKRNIIIYDARGGDKKLWTPENEATP